VRPLHHRRLALALVVLAWLAQQLGFAAHAPMQLGVALGTPLGEICTSAGLAPVPGDPASPAEHRSQASSPCDLCATNTLPALVVATAHDIVVAEHGPSARQALQAALPPDPLRHANRSRAPPSLPA
jgi:hypothetical protein